MTTLALAIALSPALGLAAPAATTAAPARKDAVSLVPRDTLILVQLTDIGAARGALKKTHLWDLYKDPAMQAFVVPAEKAIRKKFDELLDEAWKELEMDSPPENLPIPTGRVIFALQMDTKTIQVPEYDWENYDWQKASGPPPVKGMKTLKIPHPKMLFIAEMGDKMPDTRNIFARIDEQARDKGWQHESDTIRGIEVHVYNPPPVRGPDGEVLKGPDGPSRGDPFCYYISGQTLCISSNADLLKATAARMAGVDDVDGESLADDEACTRVLRKLGAPAGDLSFYLNIRSLLDFLIDISDAKQTNDLQKKIAALGFDNVTGLGIVASLAPNDKQEFLVKGLLAVNGEKKGIPALLAPPAASTAGNALLTKGLASVLVANYDFGTFYEKIRQIVIAAGGGDIAEPMKAVMAGTSTDESTPPVDLAKDLLDQLASPMVVRVRMNKPYTDPGASKIIFSIGVRDAEAVQAAIGRIHETFIARGNKDMVRELMKTKIFLLPGAGLFQPLFMMGAAMGTGEDTQDGKSLAIAVPGNHLVIGSVTTVEQEIRNLRRTDSESIDSDPMYRLAASALPASAGIWFYSNDRIRSEAAWAQLKAGSDDAEGPTNCPVCGADLQDSPNAPRCPKCGANLRRARGGAGMNPFAMLIRQTKDYCDFSTLPDFEAVKKYFGASVGYVKSTEDGIYFQTVSIKPPLQDE